MDQCPCKAPQQWDVLFIEYFTINKNAISRFVVKKTIFYNLLKKDLTPFKFYYIIIVCEH